MKQIKDIRQEMMMLKVKDGLLKTQTPLFLMASAVAILGLGIKFDNPYLKGASVLLVVLGLINFDSFALTQEEHADNQELYFSKMQLLTQKVKEESAFITEQLKTETDLRKRKKLMSSLRELKSQDVFRKMDAREVLAYSGRKRKKIALGLKYLRRNIRCETIDSYTIKRENILSYF